MTHYHDQIENETGYEVTSLSTHNSLVAENAKLRLIVEKLNKNPEYIVKELECVIHELKNELIALNKRYANAVKLINKYKDKLDKYGLGDK